MSRGSHETPLEGKFSLQRIKEVLVFKALSGGLFQTLRSFFMEMELKWGDTQTAHAERRGEQATLVLGRKFFSEEVQNEEEAADVVMHEIMHHLFMHLFVMDGLGKDGYSHHTQNLAMDAIINAYLHSVGFSGFMARYYEDREEYSFFRPGSTKFLTSGFLGRELPLKEKDEWKYRDFVAFYDSLYFLYTSLEEALSFFKEHFPDPPKNPKKLLGKHGSERDGDQITSDGSGDPDVFSQKDAKKILEDLGLLEASDGAKNNFDSVVRKITASAKKPGPVRLGYRQSRRLPAKLRNRDLMNIERGRDLFTRSEYRSRDVWLLLDYSGSMHIYKRFCIDLAKTLRGSGFTVHPVIWASGLEEVPYDSFINGEIPKVGAGTDGEIVAKFLYDNNIPQCIIVTDNRAGGIKTKVRTKVHLCLVKGAAKTGSFANKEVIPHCEVYWLEP